MFAPGAAERRFQPLLDSALADRVVDSGRFGIVDEVAERFESNLERRNAPLGALDRESDAARAALESKGAFR
jgi:hypothetical protein